MKKILMILSILLLTGCTINYDLEINNNSTNESITGSISKNEFDDITDESGDHNIYHLLYDKQASLSNNTSFYDQNINEKDGVIDFSYKYTYNNDFKQSNILNRCFENKVFEETDDLYIIHLYGNFYCQYNDEIAVNVKTKMAVLDNNANKIDENTYSWIIEDSNNVDISMTVSKKLEAFTSNNESSIFTPYRIITFVVFIILVLALFIIYRKRNSEK